MAKMNNSGNVPEGIYKCTSRSITNDNYEDSIKSKRELSHMWDERRCDEPHLDEDLIMGISSHQMQKMMRDGLLDGTVFGFVDL